MRASPSELRAHSSRPLALTHHVFERIAHVNVNVNVNQNLAGQHDGAVFAARSLFLKLGQSIT